jgi:hypothetical protein
LTLAIQAAYIVLLKYPQDVHKAAAERRDLICSEGRRRSLPQELIYAMQTGDRFTYNPSTARAEMEGFRNYYQNALISVKKASENADSSALHKTSLSHGGA